MNINLYINYYNEKNSERRKEIEKCVSLNLNNKLLNTVVINSDNRMMYSDFFRIINNYTNEDDINVMANLDIYFDPTILLAKKMNKDDFYCLCRWEVSKTGAVKFFNRIDSQDVWIFKGKSRDIYSDFNLGYQGCDNRLAFEAKKIGYNVSGPSLDIRSYHLHNSNIRNYSFRSKDKVVPEPYQVVYPEKLL